MKYKKYNLIKHKKNHNYAYIDHNYAYIYQSGTNVSQKFTIFKNKKLKNRP